MAKILIVDDSDTLRAELRGILEAAGHSVIEGSDGVVGLKQATDSNDIELIITDLNMPEMDGLMMCERIRALDKHKETPIFMLTTEYSIQLKQAAKEVGILAWLVKPFSPDKITLVVTKGLSRGAK
jgi:two-component system, chemotaxis family, chemotaxis protein CheY